MVGIDIYRYIKLPAKVQNPFGRGGCRKADLALLILLQTGLDRPFNKRRFFISHNYKRMQIKIVHRGLPIEGVELFSMTKESFVKFVAFSGRFQQIQNPAGQAKNNHFQPCDPEKPLRIAIQQPGFQNEQT